jgi:predicted lipid-binding transport protein (Tim44 family)
MRNIIVGALLGILAASFAFDAEAQRRLGGGRNIGKQSQTLQQRQATPPQQTTPQQAAPAQQPNAAAPAAAPGAAAAAARPASPWRGALMGAAAGLGLMALASYLGFGEAFATFMLFALIGLILAMVVAMIIRRRAQQQQPAYPGGYAPREEPRIEPMQRRAQPELPGARPGSAMDEFARGAPAATLKQPWGVPADFDTAGFLARAKGYYADLQAAWDTGNLDQLAEFTTQQMFTELTHELHKRGGNARTEIVTLDAALLGIESGATEHLASVRFTGTLRIDGEIEQVEEVWNLSKPVDGSTGWLLAGIQQLN